MTIVIQDETGSIPVNIFTLDAEKLIPYAASDLKDAKENGTNLHQNIAMVVQQNVIVAFVGTYDSTFHGQTETRISVVKAYRIEELLLHPNLLSLPPSAATSQPSSATEIGIATAKGKEQHFCPSTKLILEEISSEATGSAKSSASPKAVKRALQFLEKETDASSLASLAAEEKELSSQLNEASPAKKNKEGIN